MKTPKQLEEDYSFYKFNHSSEYKDIESAYYSKLEKLSELPFSKETAEKILELNDWFENEIKACNYRFKYSVAELFDLDSLKIKVKIAEVFNELLEETKETLVVDKGNDTFIGALFTKDTPMDRNVVKSVLEEKEYSYTAPTIDIMLGAYELLKENNMLAKDDKTFSTMLHWQHLHGFSDNMFIENYKCKSDTELFARMEEWNSQVKENGASLKDVPVDFVTTKMCENAVENNRGAIIFVPKKLQTEDLLAKALLKEFDPDLTPVRKQGKSR